MIPEPIDNELQDELISFLLSGETLDRFSLKKYLHKAESIDRYDIRHMIIALAHASARDYNKANDSFRIALQSHNERVQRNYLAYLNASKQIKKYVTDAYGMIGNVSAQVIRMVTVPSAIFFGDKESAKTELERLLKNPPLQDFNYQHIIYQYEYFVNNFGDFMAIGNITDKDFDWINNQILEVCEKLKTLPLSTQHYVDREHGEVAFITTVSTRDPEIIANMDFELAMLIAGNDSFLERGITGWFKPFTGEEVASL
ncbi:TPA: hypothetical protein PC505_001089 [Morganella morganii]|nr:hypothetical protein [Morganella morganii]HDF2362489.1 hypothetical protein [Morganella morganii]HDF2421715.1 hypothetical protein [Morganella morganii]